MSKVAGVISKSMEQIIKRCSVWEPELTIMQQTKENGKWFVQQFTRSKGWFKITPFDSHIEADLLYEQLVAKHERE